MNMKKTIVLSMLILSLAVTLLGCSGKKDKRTMDDFIKAYTDKDIEVDKDNKQLFQLVGASDGVMFDFDDKVVKIYAYDSEKDLENAKKDYEIIKDWDTNGRFLLETDSEDAIETFNNVE